MKYRLVYRLPGQEVAYIYKNHKAHVDTLMQRLPLGSIAYIETLGENGKYHRLGG